MFFICLKSELKIKFGKIEVNIRKIQQIKKKELILKFYLIFLSISVHFFAILCLSNEKQHVDFNCDMSFTVQSSLYYNVGILFVFVIILINRGFISYILFTIVHLNHSQVNKM